MRLAGLAIFCVGFALAALGAALISPAHGLLVSGAALMWCGWMLRGERR